MTSSTITPLLNSSLGFAPGKIILSGEHSVVYGHPAVVLATQLGSTAITTPTSEMASTEIEQDQVPNEFRERVQGIFTTHFPLKSDTVQLSFRTELPIQSGMGSSASLAAAAFRSLARWTELELTDHQLFELVQESERAVHGNPSGVDAAAVVYQGAMKFQKQSSGAVSRQPLSLSTEVFPRFFLIHTGKPVETTKEMVSAVAESYQNSSQYRDVIAEIGQVTAEMIMALQAADLRRLFALVEQNQRLLEELGIVSQRTQQLVRQLHAIGAVAKVTGAGGKQAGSGMLVVFHPQPQKLRQFCQSNELQFLETAVEYGRTQ